MNIYLKEIFLHNHICNVSKESVINTFKEILKTPLRLVVSTSDPIKNININEVKEMFAIESLMARDYDKNIREKLLNKAVEHERKTNRFIIDDLKLIERTLFNLIEKKLKQVVCTKESLYNDLYLNFVDGLNNLRKEFIELNNGKNKFFDNSKTIQLKTNKMPLLVDTLINNVSKEEFIKLLENGFAKYVGLSDNELYSNLPNFDDKKDWLGNSAFSLIALTYLMNISSISDVPLNELLAKNSEYISLNGDTIKVLIKPIYMSASDVENYEAIAKQNCKSSLVKIDNDNVNNSKFFTVGKGYEFGGYQNQSCNDEHRREDCSSWICGLTGIKRMSTADMVKLSNNKNIKTVNSDDIKPGDIMCYKGHTGIVSQKKNNEVVRVLSYARDVPNYEGVGYKDFKINDNDKPRKFFRLI